MSQHGQEGGVHATAEEDEDGGRWEEGVGGRGGGELLWG